MQFLFDSSVCLKDFDINLFSTGTEYYYCQFECKLKWKYQSAVSLMEFKTHISSTIGCAICSLTYIESEA